MNTRDYVARIIGAAAIAGCALPVACANPCIDDGLSQAGRGPGCAEFPAQDDAGSGGDDPAGGVGGPGVDDSGLDGTGAESDSIGSGEGGGTGDDGESDDSSTPIEVSLWCVDADGDGFGDPDQCVFSVEPVPGSVGNASDCDDTHAGTFPGAAPQDDPEACMRDEDDDDWGDDHPPAGVEPGTDCLDTNPFAFPGAAQDEDMPEQCMLDADDDGWGDASPGEPGPVPGNDCYDANSGLNPASVRLTTFLSATEMTPQSLALVDPADATLEPAVTIINAEGSSEIEISTATIDEAGRLLANDLETVQLHQIDYGGEACMSKSGEISPVGDETYGVAGDIMCGIEFGNGVLYGIDNDDSLRIFDAASGQIVETIPIQTLGIPLNINSCGMAFDCTGGGRLLVANGINNAIYEIDPVTAEAVMLRDLGEYFDAPWEPVGMAYDQLAGWVYISTGTALYRVTLEDDGTPPLFIEGFGRRVSNLQYLPICI